MAPPPVMNQTWLPSQCGPTVLMIDAAFDVVASGERQQRADAHVVAVHDGEADQQHADQEPPDDFQCFVIEHFPILSSVRSACTGSLA